MKLTVTSVVGDAGGAEALAPVLVDLASRGALGRILASPAGRAALGRARLTYESLDFPVGVARAEETLRQTPSSLLLTTTSWGRSAIELDYIEAATKLGIPTLAVLDFWSNYRERFWRGDPNNGRSVYPDRIAVMDERAQAEAVAAGLPAERLSVTGNPHHDALLGQHATFDREARLAFRERMGIPRKATLVLFASQPIEALYGKTLGYTEAEVLPLVARAAERVAQWLDHSVVLAVRPHPREGSLLLPQSSDRVDIRTAQGGDPLSWCLASDLVTGMTSALLFDSALLGSRVVSVQPGLHGPDPLPSNRMGVSEVVYHAENVPAAIYRGLARPAHAGGAEALVRLRSTCGGAVARVLMLIDEMAAQSLAGAER